MISLGRRDGREDLGIGFGSEREMEDTELEEGEACSYHNINNNDDDYDASMDPDIALSYIDEKLQDVLGHFQKDFEGGVSAENLGAKFGGYGSFLPTYQRSPGWSHPRTSPKIQHRNASRSPNNLQLEGGRRSSVSSSTASQSLRLEPSSTVLKTTSSLNETVKQEACVPSTHFAEELVPRDECVNRKSASLQKMLKVRIKVGSDNLSTQKNAAIYSGLGLDVSPSSSMDDSPSESEGMSHDPQDAHLESPNYILQIMTSFPVHGALLLSPLPDDLLHLKEMENFIKDSGCLSVPRFGPENSCIVVNGSSSVKGDGTMFGEKKIKSMARNELSAESKSDINKDSGIGVGVISKEIELDTFACEELVSNTLKLPLLSNSYSAVVGTSKGMGRASNVSKGVMSDKGFSGLTKEELPVPVFTQENGLIKNSKSKSSGKVWEDRKAISLGSDSVSPRKDGHRKGEKPHESVKIDLNVSKGRKAQNQAPTEPAKQNADEKAMSYEQEGMKLPHAKESSSEGKKKLKGSQSHGTVVAEAPKESFRLNSSLAPKNKKSSYADNYTTKVESEDLKLQKNSGKAGDRYREFFGDMEPEQEEFGMSTLVKSYEDRLEDFEMVELGTHGTNSTSKERSSSKKVDNLLTSEAFPKAASTGALHNGDGPITDTAPAEDNWVCCDKCQTWRLLPPRTNPDDLPEKWLCSMLDWLPGMNRCSFSEDETTLATRSLKQNTSGGDISKETVAGVWHPDQSHQNFGSHAALPGGRKKHGSKELSNMMYKEDGPIQLSNHTKKSLHAPVTNRGLNDVKPALVASEPDSLKPSKSNLAAEKHKHKPKDKHRGLDNFSDRGGGSKRSKGKGKRDPDQDCFRASKKIRTEGFPEDWTSDHGGAIEKVGPPSSNGLAMASSGKNPPKYNDCTSKNMKHDQKDWAQLSAKNPKEDVRASLDNGSVDMGNCDDRDTKKRKVKESHDAQLYQDSLPNTGHHLQDSNIMAKEEFSENDYRKVKKPRVSRSEGKEASGSKSNGRTDKKGSHRKNQQLRHDLGSTLSQRSLDGVDSLKRDSGSLHVAANSSSSKVSGSHKTKSNFPDAKGSPVESVSSSPMRVSKPEKLASARKNVTKKDASVDAGFFAPGGPRRFSDGEDDGGNDQSGTARKAKTLVHIVPSPDIADGHLSNDVDFLSQNTPHRSKPAALDPCHDDERRNENHHLVNGSRPRKSGKGSSSRSKDKTRKFNSEFENEVKVSNSFNAEAPSYEVRPTNCKNKTEVKLGIKPEENEDRYVDKKEYQGQVLSDNSKRVNQLNVRGPSGSDVEVGATRNHDAVSTPKQSVLIDNEKVSDRGTTQSLPSSGGAQNETLAGSPHPNSLSHQGNSANMLVFNASAGENTEMKELKQSRKVNDPNGINHHHHHSSSRNASSNGHRVRDLDGPSSVKRDSSSQAANNALKEATNMKHMADRVKNAGSNLESTRLYFEAALKFLHGASLLEICSGESAKNGEPMQVYSSTAKLCEFCAHEYEKSKDMAAAALAYKCMEVAYMRAIYSSHTTANRDRHELQMALQIIPPGESPSSSASDIDNLNHTTIADKVPLTKGVSSPQVTGSHIIAARNRPSFVRLLRFAQDVNSAMEASRKSRLAFAAANVSLGEARCGEGISSIKTALDFNFQDVEGLLRLVRLAIEAISR